MALVIGGLATATACSAPGSGSTTPTQGSTGSAAAGEAPTCGDDPVTLEAYIETGFPLPKALMDEFIAVHPDIWNEDIGED